MLEEGRTVGFSEERWFGGTWETWVREAMRANGLRVKKMGVCACFSVCVRVFTARAVCAHRSSGECVKNGCSLPLHRSSGVVHRSSGENPSFFFLFFYMYI